MGEALKRVLQQGAAPANGAGLAEPLLDLFAQDLLRFSPAAPSDFGIYLGSLSPDLPGRLLAYVVDGADRDALAKIKVSTVRAFGFGPSDIDLTACKRRWRIYDRWDEVPPDVMRRFAHVLAAGSSVIAGYPRLELPASQGWLEALIRDLVGLSISIETYQDGVLQPHPKADLDRLGVLMAAEDISVESLILAAFTARLATSQPDSTSFVGALGGFGAAVAKHKAAIVPLFQRPAHAQRLRTASLLAVAGREGQRAFADALVELALDSSKQVRDAAWRLAVATGEAAERPARAFAVNAKPEQRALALRLLWESGRPEAREFVRARGHTDKAASVKEEVARLTSAPSKVEASALVLPAPRIDAEGPTLPEARALLMAWLEQVNATAGKPLPSGGQNGPQIPSEALTEIAERVDAGGPIPAPEELQVRSDQLLWGLWARESEAQYQGILRWFSVPGVGLVHLVRLLKLTRQISSRSGTEWRMAHGAETMFRNYMQSRQGSLLDVARALEAVEVPVSVLIEDWYRWGGARWMRGLRDDAVWPFFHAYPQSVAIAFTANTERRYWGFTRERVFDALATFPALPPDITPALVEMALGSAKTLRTGAQRVLGKHPRQLDFAAAGLAEGRAEVRIAAALWLARQKNPAAREPLERALKKERNDAAQDAILTALEALGVPIERYLDRKELTRTAAAGLEKGLPQDLLWFPLDQLPAVRWEGKGGPVAPEILRWFLVQACRLKTPEPGALLRRYCAMFRAADREALGAFVLSAWLAHDLAPHPREKAEQRSRSRAQNTCRWMSQRPQDWENSPIKGLSEDQLFAHYLPGELRVPAGSAIASKGVLAVVAACGGGRIAPMVGDYLKAWYGYRAAQGKALIQMLAWTEHPAATQLMLSVGSRFRTKGFQEEATKQAKLLAERKGWTLDELADRTIPMAGFDESGTMTLDYGERKFHARLTESLAIELETEDGKPIKVLPEPRKSEDDARAKEAKKLLGTARKELKSVIAMQKDRLYEALCTERRWRLDDWSLYLLQHPIMRRHCQRLVWIAVEDGRTMATLRPLDDGTFTDPADTPVMLAAGAYIVLAHDTNCGPGLGEAWLAHFADYAVTPLFQQFGKGSYTLPEEKREATVVSDFQGHVLETFKLRGAATKLGYQRGATEDGGRFFGYTKRFPALGIEARLAFSGSELPERNHPIALTDLSFLRQFPGDGGTETLALGEVPRVLFSECWNDMRLIAAAGSGFDPAWKQMVEW